MATPPDKPTDASATKPPAPRKPATPRKTPRKTAASAAPKPDARKADGAASTSSSDANPASARSTAASSATAAAKTAAPRKTAAKRASSARKPSTVKPIARAAVSKPAAAKSSASKAANRKPTGTGTGRRWGIAAAVTAAGAAVTAGLLALRGSTPAKDDVAKEDLARPNAGQTAHQADGTDSSKSFQAGIADEGTIPE